MLHYAELFANHLDSENIQYTKEDDRIIRVTFKGENMERISILAFFDKDGDPYVYFKCIDVISFKEKPEVGALTCSQLNDTYRWTKFYLDKNSDVLVDIDLSFCEENCGETCLHFLSTMLQILDEAYPTLAKARWA